ncbi:MAG: hypothetical protein J5497_04235, partial [Selenomonadaceae bacterium]|nr:hypothetical protein [Selenomonadaceae bacterium]
MTMAVGGANPYVSTYNAVEHSSHSTVHKTASGSNYPSAAYGGSESAIDARRTSDIGATEQSIRNTQNFSAMLKTAEGAVNNTVKALTTIKER